MNKLVLILFSLLTLQANAQLKDQAISIGIMPTIGYRIMTYKGDVSAQYKDSIKKMDKMRYSIGLSAAMSFTTSRNTGIRFGLEYMDAGFRRVREDLRFLDTIHPNIGIVRDLSQTGGAYAEFNYSYKYMQIPFLFTKNLELRSLIESKLHFFAGGSISVLLKHQMITKLRGFSTREGKDFKWEGVENEPQRFNFNLHTGFRLENPVYGKNTFIYLQPGLYFPILNANRSYEKAHLYAFSLQLGVMVRLDKDKA